MWKEWKCIFTANNIVETPGEENERANQLVKDRKRAIFLDLESENYCRERYSVELSLNGVVCDMEIDTAADFSIMSKSIYDQFSHFPLYPSAVKLKTYTGETLQVSGEMKCELCTKIRLLGCQL
jgi:hypothetical protein